jgi:hypothetical protein
LKRGRKKIASASGGCWRTLAPKEETATNLMIETFASTGSRLDNHDILFALDIRVMQRTHYV